MKTHLHISLGTGLRIVGSFLSAIILIVAYLCLCSCGSITKVSATDTGKATSTVSSTNETSVQITTTADLDTSKKASE